jgi:hypothetical protein
MLKIYINPLNADLNPIRHLLALLGAHHYLYVRRIRVNSDVVKGRIFCKVWVLRDEIS